MIASRAVVGTARDSDWMENRFGDHVWKIQWAVWTPSLTGGRIDPKDFEEARRFAQSMHARRMRGLYVNPNADTVNMVPPRAAVRVDQATSVLNMVRARLEMEKATGATAIDGENNELRWFLDTVNDEIGAKRIFSKPFIEKYQELSGDTRAWVIWARSEFDKIVAEEKANLRRELARVPSAPGAGKPKWMIKIRLYTPSHSIRPKVLSFWNKQVGWAKLIHVGKKKELLLELSLANSFLSRTFMTSGFRRANSALSLSISGLWAFSGTNFRVRRAATMRASGTLMPRQWIWRLLVNSGSVMTGSRAPSPKKTCAMRLSAWPHSVLCQITKPRRFLGRTFRVSSI